MDHTNCLQVAIKTLQFFNFTFFSVCNKLTLKKKEKPGKSYLLNASETHKKILLEPLCCEILCHFPLTIGDGYREIQETGPSGTHQCVCVTSLPETLLLLNEEVKTPPKEGNTEIRIKRLTTLLNT